MNKEEAEKIMSMVPKPQTSLDKKLKEIENISKDRQAKKDGRIKRYKVVEHNFTVDKSGIKREVHGFRKVWCDECNKHRIGYPKKTMYKYNELITGVCCICEKKRKQKENIK